MPSRPDISRPTSTAPTVRWGMRDLVSWVGLVALASYYLAVSWRK